MSDPLDDLEALTDGLASPFWTLFSAYVTQEWGPSGLRYQQAVREAAEQGEKAVVELQKVLFAQQAIYRLMTWPRERRGALQAKGMAEVSAHRRGGV